MKKEKTSLEKRERPVDQVDGAIRYANQVPFRFIPVKDPFEKTCRSQFSKDRLYRVIKIK